MWYKINDIKLPYAYTEKMLINAIESKVGKIGKLKILKRGLDARKKQDIKYVFNCAFSSDKKLALPEYIPSAEKIEQLIMRTYKLNNRPIIVGSGPAGLFAGLTLAYAGLRPIIIERGEAVESRAESIATFNSNGILNENSNIQFGEGGAGTFSDGKLNTGTNNEFINVVLNEFVNFGADESIIYSSKPHIGTDILKKVVTNIRAQIVALGGEYKFNTVFKDLNFENDKLISIKTENETIDCDNLILACGHSARDTYEMLHMRGVAMEAKAFAVGARIEHPQSLIDMAQYGDTILPLPAADYKLSHRLANGRGCFTFCMCPGGYVMASSSEYGGVVTNGMSEFARNSGYANSAVLVGIEPKDYGCGILDGIQFQRKLEKFAYDSGDKYSAPGQKVVDFLADRQSKNNKTLHTTYPRGVYQTNLSKFLPKAITDGMKEGLKNFETKIKGFSNGILIGVETRSSAPLRILRDTQMQSNIKGLFPCGEGAGYAGGITSSAVDGIRVALALIEKNF